MNKKIALLKHLAFVFVAVVYYIALSLKYRNYYFAGNAFYRKAQEPGASFFKKAALEFLESGLDPVFRNYGVMKANIDNEEISDIALKEYSDDSLMGYGDPEHKKHADNLLDQPRGLMIPLVEKYIAEIVESKGKCRAVEIGASNGDVVAYLAERLPGAQFVGVDLSVKNADIKYGDMPNVEFEKGYALHLLRDGKISGDIVFAASTFAVFTPMELDRYIELLASAGFRYIVINEPYWGGHTHTNDNTVRSSHVEKAVWFHNYAGYFRKHGYEVLEYNPFKYDHPVSPRPDICRIIISGMKQD